MALMRPRGTAEAASGNANDNGNKKQPEQFNWIPWRQITREETQII